MVQTDQPQENWTVDCTKIKRECSDGMNNATELGIEQTVMMD